MSEFKNYHPFVNFIYFFFIIMFSMFFLHPLCLLISFFCSISYLGLLNRTKALKFNLFFLLPTILFTSIINPLFNHQGITILAYFPSGNPLTFESVLYGISSGLMLAAAISWFSNFNKIMTNDKLIFLFGKISPSVSLILSMSLRFIPRFKTQFTIICNAQKNMGKDILSGKKNNRIKNTIALFSSLFIWAFESAVDTSKSMKARGYGAGKRSAFSIYIFGKRDIIILVIIMILVSYIIVSAFLGMFDFVFYPKIIYKNFSLLSITAFCAYLVLGLLPAIIELLEMRKWKLLRQKI